MKMFDAKSNAFDEFGFMADCSRGAVPTIETLKKLSDILVQFGYTYLGLYLEDMYEIEGEPYFGYMRGRYSREEIRELDEYCQKRNLELRPCIQTLAHLGRLKRHRDYFRLFDIDDIFTVNDPEVYTLIDKMFRSVSSCFSSRRIHIGMDEAMNLGRGKFLDLNGREKKSKIMEMHLKKVSEIARKYGFRCEIWADMCSMAFEEEERRFELDIPENIVPVVWRYEKVGEENTRKELERYLKICSGKIHYAGGAWKWIGLVPANRYSFETIREQIEALRAYGIRSYMLTAWADAGGAASLFSVLPSIFYASLMAHGRDLDEKAENFFRQVVSIGFDEFLKIEELNRFSEKESVYRNNAAYVLLYNDLFLGLFDELIPEGIGNRSKKCARSLSRLTKNKRFGYLFASIRDLALINAEKASLSREIYENYRAKNESKLKENAERIESIISRVDRLIVDFESQWERENKGFGLEKHLIRLGGLKERMRYCRGQILRWLLREIDSIDELEEERRDISCPYWDHDKPENNYFNEYAGIVSGNNLSEI